MSNTDAKNHSMLESSTNSAGQIFVATSGTSSKSDGIALAALLIAQKRPHFPQRAVVAWDGVVEDAIAKLSLQKKRSLNTHKHKVKV